MRTTQPFPRRLAATIALAMLACFANAALAQNRSGTTRRGTTEPPKRPNILVIMGDDIGTWNLSYINRGMMGYRTPNIDRIAKEGITFTDYYAQQSCTAGRAAFITGQNPMRTGLTKVGLPGARVGLQKEDPTIANLLKPLGYVTGQFGKNHLGDRNEFLPTAHGFDEFFGNLYHLNSEEEPEDPDYPKYPGFKEKFGPRGVLHSFATEKDDPTEQPRWGRVGKQKIEDTGPLTAKRMETVDDEFLAATQNFINKAHEAGKPFFVWFNPSRMHFYTHIRPEHKGISGPNGNFYSDGMVELDNMVGSLLDQLDKLGIADNTIVINSTDNGPHYSEWPDGGITPFRSEKNTNWEGAYRVPTEVRWPGTIPAGTVSNGIVAHQDWLPTLLAAAGEPDIKQMLLKGLKVGDTTYKVHIDGFNVLPHITGKEKESPRRLFVYPTDGGEVAGIRYDDWKLVYMEQRTKHFDIWRDPLVTLRAPKLFNLRRDPFERADTDSNNYDRWWAVKMGNLKPGGVVATEFFETFKEYPPRQKPEKWNLSEIMNRIQAKGTNN
jgi:arylsulfatase